MNYDLKSGEREQLLENIGEICFFLRDETGCKVREKCETRRDRDETQKIKRIAMSSL
jgi:hypothetical protein